MLELPDIKFPAPADVPPMRLLDELEIETPIVFGTAAVTLLLLKAEGPSVPIALPSTTLPVEPLAILIPGPVLPDMMFNAAAGAPPIWVFVALLIRTPPRVFGRAVKPVLTPIRLPTIEFAVAVV